MATTSDFRLTFVTNEYIIIITSHFEIIEDSVVFH